MEYLTDRVGDLEMRVEGMQRSIQAVGKKVASLLEQFAWMQARWEEQDRERKNEERREEQVRERKGKRDKEDPPASSPLTREGTPVAGARSGEGVDGVRKQEYHGRHPEIPISEGDDSDGWVFRAERYFIVNQLSNVEKLETTALCVEGAALSWFQWEQRRRRVRSWAELKATGEELGVAVKGLVVEEKMDSAALCLEGAALSWVQCKQRRRRVRSWEELKGLLRNRLGAMLEGAGDELHIEGGLAVEQMMVSRGRVAADDDGVREFHGEAEGQPTIDPFKRPWTAEPVTTKESISPRKGAPSTIHVVWEDGATPSQVSHKFYMGLADNGGSLMYSHHHEGVGASPNEVMMVEGQHVSRSQGLNLHSIVEPNDLEAPLMIMESCLNSDWLQHSFHSWAQRCQNANNAESVEMRKEELVDFTLWDELTNFGLSRVGLINNIDDLSGPAISGTLLLGENEPQLTASKHQRERRKKRYAVGTPDHLALEILLGTRHGATTNWWSVGIILFELIVGIPPFNAEHPQIITDNILNQKIPWPWVPEEMSYEAQYLIDQLLTEDPHQRLGAGGASEVKQHAFFRDINWDTLARQKAAFVPSSESALDTSYFMSRYSWNSAENMFFMLPVSLRTVRMVAPLVVAVVQAIATMNWEPYDSATISYFSP
ncbi:uncharacterized protein LOC127786905 [Diospyros lotus]|uniref:uncharacterized protein LOC127786905 n=1 Tax=Diospyros lotus TaxID=55363 RepID=UPI0022547338|nr:uncharacterized protein LOC127786905 [Diospyros lotus]